MGTEKLEEIEVIYELSKLKGCTLSYDDIASMVITNKIVACERTDYDKFCNSELQITYFSKCTNITLYDIELLYKWEKNYALEKFPESIKEKVIIALNNNNMEMLYDIALKNLGLGVAVGLKNIINKKAGKPLLSAEDIRTITMTKQDLNHNYEITKSIIEVEGGKLSDYGNTVITKAIDGEISLDEAERLIDEYYREKKKED